jgi:hypothetical protein
MIGNEERRKNQRCKAYIPIIFRIFNSPDYSPVKELNHSNNGISFHTRFDLKLGTIIQVRCEGLHKSYYCNSSCEGCRITTLATIKWCHENRVAGAPSYLVGAKYFEYGIGY